ncbi:MAG TPA: hypothetical protein PLX97_00145, partial [Gemmatales bacterium]|nr:hypothetical protein [Gemmatales bacterium]
DRHPVTLPEADLLLILDQGIRTWGSTRLRLTAAALALAIKAQRHGRKVYLTTSSHYREMLDVNEHKPEQLAEVLEKSDLTSHPSVAISMLAELTREQTLDVVLLSHPRNLLERAVIVANQAFHTESRLFALTVDEESNACWGEIRHGELTRVQRFHIQPVHRPETKKKRNRAIGESHRGLRWTGPVEPFASPFQVPQRYRVVDVDFDTDDEMMYVLDSSGRVTAYWMYEPHFSTLLPRVMHEQESPPLTGITGVPRGFVAFGMENHQVIHMAQFDMHVKAQRVQLAKHHGFSDRMMASHIVGPMGVRCHLPASDELWFTSMDGGCALVYDLQENSTQMKYDEEHVIETLRVQAWRKPTISGGKTRLEQFAFRSTTGEITINDKGQEFRFTPLSDGNPLHLNQTIKEVQKGGDVLCLLMQVPRTSSTILYAYSLPHFHRIGEFNDVNYFKLSASGRYLAHRLHPFCVQVLDLQQNNRMVLRTRSGNMVKVREMVAGPGWLYVRYSSRQSNYLIDWRSGVLQCTYRSAHPHEYAQQPVHRSSMVELGYTSNKDRKVHRCHITYGHRIMADELGHIWVHDLHDNLICVFLLDQTDLAGWMPDGTTFGPARLVGHDSIPDAPRLFAEALLRSGGTVA